jgi:hypothetical protein
VAERRRCSRRPWHERTKDGLAPPLNIVWTDYLRYRAALRSFDLETLEAIIRGSSERYHDVETGRTIVVGHHDTRLVVIPCDVDADTVTPVTVHAITRQQIRLRLRTGRFGHA